MRIRRLDLLRYGHFTDLSVDLPHREMDLHIIFGPNEAGKSTAMGAIEDLLFGIPATSPRNFLHDYAAMRVGAVLESDGQGLEVRRRKGNKDTLLSANDLPLPTGDGALAGLLGGADREFFARMFALDHERLRQGGRDIVEARDDVGQMLFAAGAGVAGLRRHLTAMADEADNLWGARRSGRRKYAQAEERLKTADAALREHTVTAKKWHDLKTAFESANDACLTFEREIEEKSAELRKLTRIRRVCRDVRKRADAEAAIAALSTVIILPQDAAALVETAGRDDEVAATRIATLIEQIDALKKERDALSYDEGLLQREQDIAQFHERRIQIRAGKADLPKRRAELAGAEVAISRLASDLDWQDKDIDLIIGRIPARSKLATVRGLMNRRGELVAAVENATAAMQEVVDEVSDFDSQIAASGEALDTSTLAAAIKATRDAGDYGERIANAEREFQDAEAAIQRGSKGMNPAPPDEVTLVEMPVPPIESGAGPPGRPPGIWIAASRPSRSGHGRRVRTSDATRARISAWSPKRRWFRPTSWRRRGSTATRAGQSSGAGISKARRLRKTWFRALRVTRSFPGPTKPPCSTPTSAADRRFEKAEIASSTYCHITADGRTAGCARRACGGGRSAHHGRNRARYRLDRYVEFVAALAR